jgi:hypothetical protein
MPMPRGPADKMLVPQMCPESPRNGPVIWGIAISREIWYGWRAVKCEASGVEFAAGRSLFLYTSHLKLEILL